MLVEVLMLVSVDVLVPVEGFVPVDVVDFVLVSVIVAVTVEPVPASLHVATTQPLDCVQVLRLAMLAMQAASTSAAQPCSQVVAVESHGQFM